MRLTAARLAVALAATAALSAGISVSAADERFPVGGNYGNPEGCKVIANQQSESDDLLFLTPEAVGTYAAYCTPLAIWKSGDNAFVAPVTCGHEGDEAITVEHVRVVKADEGRDAYLIYTQDGTSWGEATRCP